CPLLPLKPTSKSAIGMSALGHRQTYAAHKLISALPPIATTKADSDKQSCPLYPRERTCAVHYAMSALGQKRTSPALFCALNNALRATDQIDPNFASPPVVDNPSLFAERLHFRRREIGYLHLIHVLKDFDGNHRILQSLPRFLLLLSHNYVSDFL